MVAGKIGYIPASDAATVAEALDAGETWQAWISAVYFGAGTPDMNQPGVQVALRQMDA